MQDSRQTFFYVASIVVLGFVPLGCSSDKTTCVEGTRGCSCFPNRTCNGSLVCGPAGRCEETAIDASIQDDSGLDGAVLDATSSPCSADNECDGIAETRGYLCVDGACRPCGEDADCTESAHYGADATCSQEGRCQAQASCAQVGCPDGGLCDLMSGRCRPPHTCAEIGCAFGQLCQEATADRDAQCLDDCEEGLVWNGLDGRCDPIPDNCRTDRTNSILEDCNARFRACRETEDGAHCGDCFVGYVEDDGSCRPVETCADLDCAGQSRTCVPESGHADAVCGVCLPGYGEHYGQCEQQEGATCDEASSASILAECAAQGRQCLSSNNGAACGSCIAGRVENPSTGLCEVEVSCADLDCGARHRDCADTYNGHCTDCLSGYVDDAATGSCVCAPGSLPDDSGVCETIRTCSDIQAQCNAQNMLCIDATASHHAYCAHCPAGQTWYEHQQTCLLCPPCTKPGETGQLWPVASLMGHCVCETMKGYYHSEAGLGGTFACDKDGDGWVSADARLAMEAPEGGAVRANARCDLRTIDRIVLRNEWGEKKEIALSDFDFLWDAVPLYEPVNRDRDDKLANDYDYTNALMINYAPPLGDAGRPLTAAELNPFTKACATGSANPNARYADYNADGHPDIDDPGWSDDRDDSEERIFAMFSYYIELYHGWYEARDGDGPGQWVIQEKTRSLYGTAGDQVPLTYPPGRLHWRTCRRHRDSAYSPSGPVYGFDFAQFGEDESCDWSGTVPGSWCGFNHHSQFKCMEAVSASDRDPAYPHHEVPSEIVVHYEVNQCDASSDSRTPTTANPSDPVLTCHLAGMPHSGSLVWGAAKYADYGHDEAPNDAYVRGCVNECAEADELPPARRCQGTPTPSCRGLADDYGKLFCYRPISFVTVPMAGHSFVMGSPPGEAGRHDDESAHVVNFTDDKAYSGLMVMTTEVTQDQFEEYMGFNPSRFDCGNSVCPVEQVTWYDALAFANVLSDREGLPRCYDFDTQDRQSAELRCADGTQEHQYDPQTGAYLGTWCRDHGGVAGLVSHRLSLFDAAGWLEDSSVWRCDGYRLPSEAEWEYLARAGSQTALWNGDLAFLDCNQDPVAGLVAWTCADGGFGPNAVGMKSANPFGLFDMNGNVWEWTSDEYDEDYVGGTRPNPSSFEGSFYGNFVVTARGGAWNRGVQDSRSARRQGYAPGGRNYAVGFRLVRTLFEYDYHHYQAVAVERPWADAEQDCVNRGGHLASIANMAEQVVIRKAAWAFSRENDTGDSLEVLWFGLNDRQTEGQWQWSDGSPYLPPGFWSSGEPDGGTRANCMSAITYDLDWDHAWRDSDCSTLFPYICKLP